MDKINIFTDISLKDKEAMLECFHAEKKHYYANSLIMNYASNFSKIGIIQSGNAVLCMIDLEGHINILADFTNNEVFGELFSLPFDNNNYFVKASSDCDIIFIEYQHLIKRCNNACLFHSQLVNNLFHMTAETTRRISMHLHLLSQRTIRNKLIAYFDFLALEQHRDTVQLPITYTTLADYLCIDRSAMMREIKKLNTEQLISSKGKKISLIYIKNNVDF